MAFDFGKLGSTGAIAGITKPAVLFDALPNKADGYWVSARSAEDRARLMVGASARS